MTKPFMMPFRIRKLLTLAVLITMVGQVSISENVFARADVVSSLVTQINVSPIRSTLSEKLGQLGADELVSVIIKYDEKIDDEKRSWLKSQGSLLYEYTLFNGVAARLPKAAVELLAATDRQVTWIEYDLPVTIFLDSAEPVVGADKVQATYGVTGKGVTVAVLDSGVDKNHPSLVGSVAKQVDFTGEGVGDKNGHGTHVACEITCDGADGLLGIAADAAIYNVKVLNGDGEGVSSDIIAGLEWAVKENVDVVNMSLGGFMPKSCDGTDPISVAADAAFDKGVLVVAAAGNTGPLAGTIGTPACAKKVLAVGAVNDSSQVALFSSRGPTADGRVKPDIFAPGVSVTSAALGGGTATLSGTSQAAPFVAATAALLLEADFSLTPNQLKSIMLTTATPLTRSFVNTQDQGVLNSLAAVGNVKGEVQPDDGDDNGDDNGNDSDNTVDDALANMQFNQAREEVTLCLRQADGDVAMKSACMSEFLLRQREIQLSRFTVVHQTALVDLAEVIDESVVAVSKNSALSQSMINQSLASFEKIASYLFDESAADSLQAFFQRNLLTFAEGSNNEVATVLSQLNSIFQQRVTNSRESKFAQNYLEFRDTDDDQWFYIYVKFIQQRACVSGFESPEGVPLGEYRPGNNLTVAEALKVALECAGVGAADEGTTEVTKAVGHWSEDYWVQAEDMGMTIAENPNENPDRPIKRGETVMLIFEAFGEEALEDVEHLFADVPASRPDADYIESARVFGIVSGFDGTNNFGPDNLLNRAEMAKITMQSLDVFE